MAVAATSARSFGQREPRILHSPPPGIGLALELVGCNPAQQYCRGADREPPRHRIDSTGSLSSLRNQRGNCRRRNRLLEHLKLSLWRRQGSRGTRKHRPSGNQPGYSQEQEHPAHDAVSDISAVVNFQGMESCGGRDSRCDDEKHDTRGQQPGTCGVACRKDSKPVLQVPAI